MAVEFVKSRDKRPGTITVRRDVTELKSFRAFQSVFRSPKISFAPQSYLHMTVFHIGKPQELLRDAKVFNPGLSQGCFQESLANFLYRLKDINLDPVSAYPDNLAVFGSANNPLLVLKLQKTPELMEGVGTIKKEMEGFLGKIGVSDITSFAYIGDAVRFHLLKEPDPHITLGKLYDPTYLNAERPFSPGTEIPLSKGYLKNVSFSS